MTQPGSTEQGVQFGVRWKLIGPFVLIAVLVVAILLPLTNWVVSRRIEAEADRRLSEVGNSVSVLLQQSKQEAELSATFISSLPEIIEAGNDAQRIGRVLDARRAELDLQELSFYSPDYQSGDGAFYYSGPEITRPFQAGNEMIRDALIFQTLAGGTVDSRIAIAPRASEIMGASPVYSESGEIAGVIIAVYYLDDSFMQKMSDVVTAELALVEGHAVIASTLEDTRPYENYIREGFIENIDGYVSQNIETEEQLQQRLLAQPLMIDGEEQGVIMVAQPIASLFGIRQDINYIIGMFAAIIVLITALFAIFSYFNFARPLAKLTQATNRISAGQFDEQVSTNASRYLMRDEITVLSENFNRMTVRLKDLYTGLEQRVEERTHSLEERTHQLIEHQNKLNQALVELSEARDQALEANRIKSAFMANMSHELRTPLNAIIGYTNLVIGRTYGEINETQEDRLKRVYDNGQHLLQLINDVLDLSKVEAGKMEVYLESFELSPLLDTVVKTAAALMDKNQNQLVRQYPNELGMMRSDVTKVRQVLFNLISNAAKFTEKGTVTLTLTDQDKNGIPGVLIQVTDSGIGMTPEQLNKVFEAFTQADISTTRKYGGTGLGLAISRQFCEMLGGSITVSSEVNVGTTFSVWLPRESVDPKAAAEKRKTETGTHGIVPANKSRVLVIDDDEASLEVMQHYLESNNFHVITTNNGEDGLRLAAEYLPDVIVMDVLMPGMDGWEVLSRLKENPDLSDIPVVMATIVNGREMGFALGAVDYISKPVDEDQILRVVDKYRPATEPNPILLVEDEASARQLMRDILETAGWQVREAADGRYGLEVLTQIKPELILLDLMMPRMNGFEFIKEIRKHDDWRGIPVVVITAMDLTPEDQAELEHSVQRVIQKGNYQQDDLLKEVRRWIKASAEKQAAKVL